MDLNDFPFGEIFIQNTSALSNREYEEAERYRRYTRLAYKIYIPILLTIGTTGNVFVVLIFNRSSMPQNAMNVLLRALAILDIFLLWCGLHYRFFIGVADWNWTSSTPVGCRLHKWLLVTVICTIHWMLVIITIGRYLSIRFPIQAVVLCKPKVGYICLIATVLLNVTGIAAFGYADTYFNPKINDLHPCVIFGGKNGRIFIVLLIVQLYFLPNIFIFVFNILFFTTYKKHCKESSSVRLRPGASEKKINQPFYGDPEDRARVKEYQKTFNEVISLTAVLFAASAVFFLFNLPWALFMTFRGTGQIVGLPQFQFQFVYEISILLLYTSVSLNFLFYCVVGAKFRAEFRKMINHWKQMICRQPQTRSTTQVGESQFSQSLSSLSHTFGNSKNISVMDPRKSVEPKVDAVTESDERISTWL